MRAIRVTWIALSAILTGCHHGSVPLSPVASSSLGSTSELVERGEYIVRNVSVCGTCHTQDRKQPDGPLVGGAEFKDWRLGTIRSANLTPDSATGLGTWTESEIVRAIRNGESKNGRLLAPVMRYEWFHEMSDRDAFAVARYLKTLPPQSHRVRQNPNLIFQIGKALFLRPVTGASLSPPPRGATVEYGKYLSHIALCIDCHTPTSGLQSKLDRDKLFAGQSHPPKDFTANPSNLTPDTATGIGKWSEEDFLRTIRTGENPQGRKLNDFMPWRELRRMNDEDLRAIYRYLRTVRPIRNHVPVRKLGT